MIKYTDFLSKLRGAEDKGNYITAICPFHNDSAPSLLVYKDGWFHCLSASCSRSGTWNTLWNKVSGQPIQVRVETRVHYETPNSLFSIEFASKEEMAYQAHIDLFNMTSFQWYMDMRGLADAIEVHEIGYYQGWYTFPVRDREGKFQNVVYRAAPHVQEGTGLRYWSDARPPIPYVPDWRLLDKGKYILVVYGILDALTLNKFRYPVVTSTAGANSVKAAWFDDYNKPIYIIPDKGEEQAALRLSSSLSWRGHVVYLDYPEGMKDANDFLRSGKSDQLVAQLEKEIR